MSYPVPGMVGDYRPAKYAVDHAIIRHGMSVILSGPSVFRWTAGANPERHRLATPLVGADVRDAAPEDASEVLASEIISLMRQTGMTSGFAAVGFGTKHVPVLVEGTLP